MKKVTVLFFVQLLLFFAAKAQFQLPKGSDINAVKMKTLLVPVQEEVTRTLIDLQKKPDELQAYKDGIARFNEMMKDVVDKYWKLGKGVEYKPKSEVDKLIKDGNSKYVILQYELREGQINQLMFGKVYGTDNYNTDIRRLSKNEGYSVFRLQLADKTKGAVNIYSVYLPVAYPSKGDMIYAIKMMQNELTTALKQKDYQVNEFEASVAKNNKLLKNKTLLIDPTQLDGKTTVDDLKKSYSYPIEVVEYEKVNEAIQNEDSAYAYVMVVPDGDSKVNYNRSGVDTRLIHVVTDAAGGQVLATCKPTRLNYQKVADDISRKEIKDYIIKN